MKELGKRVEEMNRKSEETNRKFIYTYLAIGALAASCFGYFSYYLYIFASFFILFGKAAYFNFIFPEKEHGQKWKTYRPALKDQALDCKI